MLPGGSAEPSIGWAVIGTGGMATRRMAPAIRNVDGARLVGVVSRSRERAAWFAAQYDIPCAYDSVDAVLGNASVDAVYVASMNDLHARHAIAAARAGKHVLCEKPLATSLADAAAIILAARAAHVVLGTNHYHRLKPSLRASRRLIGEGALGVPLVASLNFAISLRPEQRTWRVDDAKAGGGVVLDLTVHDADIVSWLFNEQVEEVVARTARTPTAGRLDDAAAGVMRMPSGLLVSFLDTFAALNAIHGFSIIGSRGSLVAENVLGSGGDGTVTLHAGGHPERIALPEWEDPFEVVIRTFDDAVRKTGRPAVTGEDGMRALAVALAVDESAHSGRACRVADIDALLSAVLSRGPTA